MAKDFSERSTSVRRRLHPRVRPNMLGLAVDRRRPRDEEETEVAVATIKNADLRRIEETARGRVRWEQWDRITPLHDLSAEAVVEEFPGMEAAYSIFVDDVRVVFQPYDPEEPGAVAMDPLRARRLAESQVERIVDTFVDDELVRLARKVLGG